LIDDIHPIFIASPVQLVRERIGSFFIPVGEWEEFRAYYILVMKQYKEYLKNLTQEKTNDQIHQHLAELNTRRIGLREQVNQFAKEKRLEDFAQARMQLSQVLSDMAEILDSTLPSQSVNPFAVVDDDLEAPTQFGFEGTSTLLSSPDAGREAMNEFISVSKITSDLTAQVVVAPIASGSLGVHEVTFPPQNIMVIEIRLGDLDRPATQFDNQESHTVAWTLVRHAIMRLAGRPLKELLAYFKLVFAEIEPFLTLDEAQRLHQGLKIDQVMTSMLTTALPIDIWQKLLSKMIPTYLQLYQLSTAATYKRGKALGHGEAHAMQRLKELDQSHTLDDKQLNGVRKDLQKLLDVQFRLQSLGVSQYAFAVNHWMDAIKITFPRLFAKWGDALFGPILDKKLTKSFLNEITAEDVVTVRDLLEYEGYSEAVGVLSPAMSTTTTTTTTTTPSSSSQLRSNFVANVTLSPAISLSSLALATDDFPSTSSSSSSIFMPVYALNQMSIDGIQLSDKDRPKTKFISHQKSHTVAWTLIRHHMMSFSEQSLEGLYQALIEYFLELKADVSHEEGQEIINQSLKQLILHQKSKLPIHVWQQIISDLLRRYFIAYQIAESSAYINPTEMDRAQGHGEASHMLVLRQTEYYWASNQATPYKEERIINAAISLYDAYITNTLNREQVIRSYRHLIRALTHTFPIVMKVLGGKIQAVLLERKVGKDTRLGDLLS
jgi:hypothetical protein